MSKRYALLSAAVTAGLAAPSAVRAVPPVIDGTLDAAIYGPDKAVQTVGTGFGNNQSELNAAYTHIENGKLYVFLSGNLESNNNKLCLFFDTRAGGQNVMRNDNPDVNFNNINTMYAGMTFDTGFAPDYGLFFSRDGGAGDGNVYVDFTELNTNGGGLGGFVGQVFIPAGPPQIGNGTAGPSGGLPAVTLGYNDSNTAGITDDTVNPADPVAARAVTTGMEFVIDLTQIGALENFNLMVGINGQNHDFWSNQFFNGLTAPQGNLGGDGAGNFTGTVGAVNFNNFAGNQFLGINYHAPLSQWNNPGNGNWTEIAKWSGDGVPNAPDARAVLGTLAGSAARQITLNTNVQLQSLTFDSPGSYTIAPSGGNTLTISGNPATPALHVLQGTHTIGAPLILVNTTNFTIAASSRLNVIGPMTATGIAVVKAGPGTLQVPNVVSDSLNVAEGTVQVASNGTVAGTSNVKSLTIAGGTTPTAKLDLVNNALVVDYTTPPPPPPGEGGGPEAEPFDTIRAQIIAAYNGGGANAWTGNGITTSLGNANQRAIGYAERSSLAAVPAIFGTVDADAVLMRQTRYGDANLDGLVNTNDFTVLAGNFNTTGKVWSQGDFNYDSIVNVSDFSLLAGNFNLSATGVNGDVTPQDWANLAAAVPEPGSVALLGLASAGMLASRRRRVAR